MTELEGMALRQAVELLEQAAIREGQSLFSMVTDHCNTAGSRLFIDYISEDEEWTADHLTDGVIGHIRVSMIDEGYRKE